MKVKDWTLIEWTIVLVNVAILLAVFVLPWFPCAKRAKLMGFRYDWGPVQGCMVEVKPGQWVPLANYRVL